MNLWEFKDKRRLANRDAIAAIKAAAEAGDPVAEERWAALLKTAEQIKQTHPEWLRLNPWWDVGSPVPAVVPVVGDEPLVGPEAPDPLPGGTRDEV